MEAETVALIGIFFATSGWLYNARKNRINARKQHTINVLLQAQFNKEFREAQVLAAPFVQAGNCPKFSPKNEDVRLSFRLVLNHYEFIAAGLRHGDFDERLVRDAQRGGMLSLYESCEKMIWDLRNSRRRQTMYEHLEWLYARWETSPPRGITRFIEWIRMKPFQGKRHDPRALQKKSN